MIFIYFLLKMFLIESNSQLIETMAKTLIKEAHIMKDYNHINVLSLIGFSFEEDKLPMLIIPLMSQDLLKFIRNDDHILTVKNLVHFAIQVNQFLSYHNF